MWFFVNINTMRNNTMKKLNITKERFEKSRYFTKKYGKLEYVSESGKMFKTSKGKVLKFNESMGDDEGNPVGDKPKKISYLEVLDAVTGDFLRKYPWFEDLELHEDVYDADNNQTDDYYVLYTKSGQMFSIKVHEM